MNKFLPPTWLWRGRKAHGVHRSGVDIKVLPYFSCEKSDDIMANFSPLKLNYWEGSISNVQDVRDCEAYIDCVVIYFIIFHCGL